MKAPGVICLYYHRISPVADSLAIPPEIFQSQLEALFQRGYHTVSLSELIEFLSGKTLTEEKPLLLSFDDGHLDFYFYAYPLLQKYQMSAIVFLVTDWVNEEERFREENQIPAELKNLKTDQAIKLALQGDRRAFLSWGMVREMAKTGLIEFGSHSKSHRLGFHSDRIKKFILSDDAYWKYYQLYEGKIQPGLPIFQKASALTIQRFLPEPKALQQVSEYCQKQLRTSAKSKDQISVELFKYARRNAPLGTYEPEAEARARILAELQDSKKIIEDKLGIPCPALSWPFGDYSQMSIELAQKAGYQLAFTTELGIIRTGQNPFALKRYPVQAVAGARLARELAILKNPVLSRIFLGKTRSRQVVQNLSKKKEI